MTATLTPHATPRRIAALTGETPHRIETIFDHMYGCGVDLRQHEVSRVSAAVQCFLSGHSSDVVEMVIRYPYIGESDWLVSTAEDARIVPSLLQAMAYIEVRGAASYRLSPVGLMMRGRF